jgi:hypothetical protein
MANDVTTVRIPGLTLGGAIQVSNTTVITTALAAVGLALVGCHFMNGMKKAHHNKKEWKRHSPRAVENKVMQDVMAFATNIHTVADNLPQIRNMVHTLRDRIKDQIRSYRAGEITQAQFDASVRNMYPMILTELGIPANTVPQQVVNKLDATVDRIADRILEGKIPAKVKFRMYKTNPGLAHLHDLGRQRALEVGQGHKYGLHKQAMHTSAAVYLKDANYGWSRPDFPGKGKAWGHDRDSPLFPGNVHSQSNFGAWFRP